MCAPTDWRNSSTALAIAGLLLYVVVGLALNDSHSARASDEIRYASVRPVFVSSRVAVGLPHYRDNRIALVHQSVDFLATDGPVRHESGIRSVRLAGWRVWGKDALTAPRDGLGHLVREPPISLLERILSDEDLSLASGLNSWGLPVIANAESQRDWLIGDQSTVSRAGHQVWPLVLAKLNLSGLPLKVRDDHAAESSDDHQRRQELHQPSRALNPFLKAGYAVLLLAVAIAIVFRSHKELFDRWNRRALLRLLLVYVVAGGIVFHVVWVIAFT